MNSDQDADEREVARIWITDSGDARFSVTPPLWTEPMAWGIALADLVRLVAKAYAEEGLRSEAEVTADILRAFVAEEFHPTANRPSHAVRARQRRRKGLH